MRGSPGQTLWAGQNDAMLKTDATWVANLGTAKQGGAVLKCVTFTATNSTSLPRDVMQAKTTWYQPCATGAAMVAFTTGTSQSMATSLADKHGGTALASTIMGTNVQQTATSATNTMLNITGAKTSAHLLVGTIGTAIPSAG